MSISNALSLVVAFNLLFTDFSPSSSIFSIPTNTVLRPTSLQSLSRSLFLTIKSALVSHVYHFLIPFSLRRRASSSDSLRFTNAISSVRNISFSSMPAISSIAFSGALTLAFLSKKTQTLQKLQSKGQPRLDSRAAIGPSKAMW